MRITECREDDVALLERQLPSPGTTSGHAERFARHQKGTGTLLVGWQGGLPVASCEVRWDGCPAPEVRAVHPGCPELSGFGLWPGVLRSPRTGALLLLAAEDLVRKRGLRSAGLGVEKNNPRAEALYGRLGYQLSVAYLACWSYEDAAGMTHQVADACTFMHKVLGDTPQGVFRK
ncbi:GNAT family N-acetyltransferase [Streptomyces sp. N2-109]|uniref:GNAT family N-acetyltransferase n=1 Tax=Streptomyces gossypii TaxID=2883101 RepID=A0ABT2K1Q9_9ACTN|nr:GNAT family N-acetyltransferase [Streptomyces gossypii]MCT2594083.1 GNAT family N-acetyltransferase [Streptomyces gossypii]